MESSWARITAGALIPAFATVVFNVMNHIMQNVGRFPVPIPDDSVYEFAFGCIFAIFGISVNTKNERISKELLLIFILLLLVAMVLEFFVPIFMGFPKIWSILFMDLAALGALIHGIRVAE